MAGVAALPALPTVLSAITSNLPAILGIASAGLTAAGTIAAGAARKRDLAFQASQLDARAKQEQAAAQREAEQRRRRTALTLSRQQSLAAASGLGASDPTIEQIAAETAGFGAEQEGLALAGGEQRAANARLSASAARATGQSAVTGSFLSAGATILGGLSDNVFQKKFGTFQGGGQSSGLRFGGDPITGDTRFGFG